MLRKLAAFHFVLLCIGLASCAKETPSAPEPEPPFQPIASTKEIMLGITIPASDVVFGAAAETPADDAAWEKIRINALALAESGNLLMIGPRATDRAAWWQFARALTDASITAAKAAQAKNADQISEAGNVIYETCDGCHKIYMAARQGA